MNKTVFSKELLDAMQNAIETAENYEIERSTPIIILKGIMDLESSSIYDYLIDNTCYDNSDIEMAFQDVLYTFNLLDDDKKEKVEEIQEEKEEKYYFLDQATGKKIICTEEVARIISRAIQIAQEQSEIVLLDHLIMAIVENIPKDILLFLRNLTVNVKDFKRTFSVISKETKNVLPTELQPFMKILNSKYKKGTRCSILERDKECEIVWTTMQKKTKRNVILVGEPGVGKSSIAKKITQDIVNGTCPECFKDFIVVSVDVNATIAGTQYRGQAEERFQKMIDFLDKTENVILFIDEVHTILGAGACRDGEMDLANALKPILAEDKVRVIGATTSEEYEKYFSRDGALKRRFRPIEIKEPTSKKVYPMLKNSISDLSKYHGVKITKSMVEYIILISGCFHHETHNPDRTIDLVDLSMVRAKEKGKAFVDKESVLENFDIEFKKFEKMDYKVKKITAYHEAGHYLIVRLSEHLIDLEGVAVSIMPAEHYLGITIWDKLGEVTVWPNIDYFIDKIAVYLAGRIAEKMYTNTISAGACSDLEKATKTAYSLVTEYGMSEKIGKNRVYITDEKYDMYNEKVVDNINAEVDKIITKAYARAEDILIKNEGYLKKLVNKLMQKGILSKKDLDKIFEEKVKV